MRFSDIVKRITGISTPIFGISWNPDKTERDFARQVISFLEDRRVLFVPYEDEIPRHCIESVLQIRHFLTSKIGELPENSELDKSLRAMRAACRKFLNETQNPNYHFPSWVSSCAINNALGELRGVFGIYTAKIAVAYGINIEKELASILPEEDNDEDKHRNLESTR
jgi:hypothetical protein